MTARKATRELENVIYLYLRAGIGSKDAQASRCLNHVCLNIGVVRMRQVGLLVGILRWVKVLSNAQCVSIGPLVAVDGRRPSASVTVEPFMCTSCNLRISAVCDTVATGCKVNL